MKDTEKCAHLNATHETKIFNQGTRYEYLWTGYTCQDCGKEWTTDEETRLEDER